MKLPPFYVGDIDWENFLQIENKAKNYFRTFNRMISSSNVE